MPFCYYSGNWFCPITVVAERLANIKWGSIGGQKLHFCFVLFVCSALLKFFLVKFIIFWEKVQFLVLATPVWGRDRESLLTSWWLGCLIITKGVYIIHLYTHTKSPPYWVKCQYWHISPAGGLIQYMHYNKPAVSLYSRVGQPAVLL